jgi:hypothetical protein
VSSLGSRQVLWLGERDTVTEVGAMNLLFFWINEDGEKELITAPLTRGDILPGDWHNVNIPLVRIWRRGWAPGLWPLTTVTSGGPRKEVCRPSPVRAESSRPP